MSPRPKHSTPLPADIERQRMIPLAKAAELRGVSLSTLKRCFPHLIVRVSPGRLAVRLGDLLDEPATTESEGAAAA
jgi:hypothetical protein